MRLMKCQDKLLAIEGIGVELKSEVEIELISPGEKDHIRINGRIFNFQDGKRRVPLSAFCEGENEIKVCSNGAWFVLEGITRRDRRLVMQDSYIAKTIAKTVLENVEAKQKIKAMEKKLEELEARCSGEEFL